MCRTGDGFQSGLFKYITTEYAKVFPEYMKDFVIEICATADGVEL